MWWYYKLHKSNGIIYSNEITDIVKNTNYSIRNLLALLAADLRTGKNVWEYHKGWNTL